MAGGGGGGEQCARDTGCSAERVRSSERRARRQLTANRSGGWGALARARSELDGESQALLEALMPVVVDLAENDALRAAIEASPAVHRFLEAAERTEADFAVLGAPAAAAAPDAATHAFVRAAQRSQAAAAAAAAARARAATGDAAAAASLPQRLARVDLLYSVALPIAATVICVNVVTSAAAQMVVARVLRAVLTTSSLFVRTAAV